MTLLMESVSHICMDHLAHTSGPMQLVSMTMKISSMFQCGASQLTQPLTILRCTHNNYNQYNRVLKQLPTKTLQFN